jgi:hypothetical protein
MDGWMDGWMESMYGGHDARLVDRPIDGSRWMGAMD